MDPRTPEVLARAHRSIRAAALSATIEELVSLGAVISFGRPTRTGWKHEARVEGIPGTPPVSGTSDLPELALEDALRQLRRRMPSSPPASGEAA